ncbi:unnamed protein product [Cylindrotheca closterium]|uniref:Orc1-like AAA ATPase domain-containing protein n=2 Tax=Cylindrotheca closterium TaxID=2856 RepID=A0AAD2GBY3_9STRA|nr:unnamed protein product [Cylindrotheca closterium]
MGGVDANSSASFSVQGSGSPSATTTKKANESRPSFSSAGNDTTSIRTSSTTKIGNEASSNADSSQGSQEKELDTKMSQLGLYGRQKETRTIRKCLDDLVSTGKNKLVYISGLSGTGKTALAATVADSVVSKNGIFAMGKFDQKLRDEPYAGIAAAGRHICGEILHRKNSSEHMDFEDIRKMIMKNVGSELSTLAMILPEIEDIVGSSELLLAQEDSAGGDFGANKERLNNAIRTFFRTVATFFKPLVMVLDDIQWADLTSINLMQVLMTDESSSNFMLIALYRSNEVDQTHVVSKMIETLDEKQKEYDFDTTKIEVGDLKMQQVDEILVDLLHLPSYRTSDLSEIIHRRTGGNAFFVLNFIDMLKNQHLVVYSNVEKCWVWDETEIELETIATDNVVDILKQRMKNLPKRMREVLQLAACLGASFQESVLSRVVTDYFASQQDAPKSGQLSKWLTKAVEAGFVKMDNVGYRWIHDKVQEAALSIASGTDLTKMRFQVGKILLRRLSRQEMDQALFVVVNLLNVGIGTEVSSSASAVTFAELNLRAAQRAMRLSGFEIAASYSDIAIGLLPDGHWQSQYKLSLKLYTLATQAHGVLDNVETMQSLYDEVLEQPDIPLKDRLPLYYAMLESLSGRDLQAGKELGYEVLEQLDHPLMKPGGKQSIFKRFNIVRDYDRNLNPETASTLPVMTDANALSAMKILSTLLVLTYMTNKAELPTVTSKMASLVNTFGVCDEAGNAYVFRGTYATDLRVIDAHGKFAKGIMDRSKDRYSKAASRMYVLCMMSHTRDIRWVLKGYEENYHYSLQVGDIQAALYSNMLLLYYALVSGHSLKSTAAEARNRIRSLQRRNRGWQVGLMTILWQGVLNMQGQSEDPFVLKGEAMDETAMPPASPDTVDGALRLGIKAIIFAFCGNHQANADEHMDQIQAASIQNAGNSIGFWFEIYTAISCLHCARSASGRQCQKYKRFGKHISKKVKRWIAQGCANVKQLDLLLDAEFAVLAGNDKKAGQLYKKSIKTAEHMPRVSDAGLASERYGEYLLGIGDTEGARDALSHALEFYSRWGSDLKVESIRSKHEELLRPLNI